jgi:hypothetical protein
MMLNREQQQALDEAQRKRYEAAFPGWRRSRSGTPRCPRVVAGKRCRIGYPRMEMCICQDFSSLLDHRKLWRTPNGESVLTAEPYGIDTGALASFSIECRELGLQVDVEGESPYYPGYTSLIVIRRIAPMPPRTKVNRRLVEGVWADPAWDPGILAGYRPLVLTDGGNRYWDGMTLIHGHVITFSPRARAEIRRMTRAGHFPEALGALIDSRKWWAIRDAIEEHALRVAFAREAGWSGPSSRIPGAAVVAPDMTSRPWRYWESDDSSRTQSQPDARTIRRPGR